MEGPSREGVFESEIGVSIDIVRMMMQNPQKSLMNNLALRYFYVMT